MIALLDVNVLVALAWPHHLFHRAAHAWFAGQKSLGWATCPVTQAGFVRLSSNPKATPEAKAPAEAIELLRRIVTISGHRFWRDDISLCSVPEVSELALVGHRQVTDAHLLSLARRNGGCLATFDRGVARLLPPGVDPASAVEWISV